MKQFIKPWRENSLICGTTTKLMGPFIKHQDPKKLWEVLKLQNKDIVFAKQLHENKVATVTREDSGTTIKNADGLITEDENLYLLLFTADCIPIFFYESINKIIGLTHAGRKGSLKNIAVNTVKAMQKIGAKAKHIKVHLGPHICNKCYQLDLAKVNLLQLKISGILEKNITVSKFCTFENDDVFYSYRREKPTTTAFNEMLSFIALK